MIGIGQLVRPGRFASRICDSACAALEFAGASRSPACPAAARAVSGPTAAAPLRRVRNSRRRIRSPRRRSRPAARAPPAATRLRRRVRTGHRDAERVWRLEVDHQFEFSRCLNRPPPRITPGARLRPRPPSTAVPCRQARRHRHSHKTGRPIIETGRGGGASLRHWVGAGFLRPMESGATPLY
jgi:hypothetical protein